MISFDDDAQERAVESNQAPTGINVCHEYDGACVHESGMRKLFMRASQIFGDAKVPAT